MKRHWTYAWPRPAVTVDMAVFSVAGLLNNLQLKVLLVRRKEDPFRGCWALPGGFVRQDEDLEDAAHRELAEEAGLTDVALHQVRAVGTPGRDPRGHVVTILYTALVAGDRRRLEATGDAEAADWFDVGAGRTLPPLAFDHASLLESALTYLRHSLDEEPVCFELLPAEFTLSELQSLYEAILGRTLDRRNFRRRILELGLLSPAKGGWRLGRHRPAQLFRFVPRAFEKHRDRSGGRAP